MADSTILEDYKTGKVERHNLYFKTKVSENYDAQGTDKTFKNSII